MLSENFGCHWPSWTLMLMCGSLVVSKTSLNTEDHITRTLHPFFREVSSILPTFSPHQSSIPFPHFESHSTSMIITARLGTTWQHTPPRKPHERHNLPYSTTPSNEQKSKEERDLPHPAPTLALLQPMPGATALMTSERGSFSNSGCLGADVGVSIGIDCVDWLAAG